jgi:hypothetical protein
MYLIKHNPTILKTLLKNNYEANLIHIFGYNFCLFNVYKISFVLFLSLQIILKITKKNILEMFFKLLAIIDPINSCERTISNLIVLGQ